MSDSSQQIAVLGLGTMGRNLALNLSEHGTRVEVWNRTHAKAQALESEAAGAVTAHAGLESLVEALDRPRRLLLMVPAGKAVDQMLERLAPLLDEGDILLDGGNSQFRRTEERAKQLASRGLLYLGVGVSGGEEGARHGPCMMPGGPVEAWEKTRPILEPAAARTEDGPCITLIGSGGSGHFVKMVHNGIEYGFMQALAEAYDILRRMGGLGVPEAAELFQEWGSGDLDSYLVEITARVLRVHGQDPGRFRVEAILDSAGQKGTGRWTVREAAELGVAVSVIAAAVDARIYSSRWRERRELARKIQGPAERLPEPDRRSLQERLREALEATVLASYAQGFELIRVASRENEWGVDLGEIARIWKGGCIIRARLLDPLRSALDRVEGKEDLLADDWLRARLANFQESWRALVADAVRHGIPVPAHAAGLAWFDSLRTARLPQNLTQAQRDAFGAHTYRLAEDPEADPVHTDWLE